MLIRGSDVVDSCVGDGEPDGDAEQERGNDPADYSNEDRVLLHVCSPAIAEGSRAVSGGHGGYPPGVYLLQPADAAEVPRNFRAGSRFIQCEMRCRNDEKASRSSTPRARRGPSARRSEEHTSELQSLMRSSY